MSFRNRRLLGTRPYKKMFVIAAEGKITEEQYFNSLNREIVIKVKCLKWKKDSSPSSVLKRMEKYLKKNGLISSDEAWLVVDRDEWIETQLNELYRWSKKKSNYHFALSNPKFEYWLLLHFEEGKGVNSINCIRKLKNYLPNYKKANIEIDKLKPGISDAVRRAKEKDIPPCEKWPFSTGTTVYRLVEKIIAN